MGGKMGVFPRLTGNLERPRSAAAPERPKAAVPEPEAAAKMTRGDFVITLTAALTAAWKAALGQDRAVQAGPEASEVF